MEDVSAMPPDKPITQEEIAAIAEWIKAVAHWPAQSLRIEATAHWAFEPVIPKETPTVRDITWSQSSIDPFILSKLEAVGRRPSRPSDRRSLMRRASYDLTGLPPDFEEVRAFEEDPAPDAFEKVIDRLLGSPAYGEQWGRHWLDVVRYADTAGENTDRPLPHAWRYRNWVIESFNEDKPYHEFVSEQIAGDLIARDGDPSAYADRIVATGFLAISRRFGHNIDKDIHLTYEDSLDTMEKPFSDSPSDVAGVTTTSMIRSRFAIITASMESWRALGFHFPDVSPILVLLRHDSHHATVTSQGSDESFRR